MNRPIDDGSGHGPGFDPGPDRGPESPLPGDSPAEPAGAGGPGEMGDSGGTTAGGLGGNAPGGLGVDAPGGLGGDTPGGDPMFGGFMASEDVVGRAGAPRGPDSGAMVSEAALIEAVRTVYDPEIPVNIYELGLIYDMAIAEDGAVAITMTLTTPGCPVAGILPQQVADAAASAQGAGEVEVNLVWDPPWTMEHMSEEARLALGMF